MAIAQIDHLLRLPIAPLVFLWSMFVLDVGVVYSIHTTYPEIQPDIPSFFIEDSYHSQWSLLLQAGLLALFVTLSCCVGVRLVAHDFRLGRVRLLALLTELFASGAGILNFFVSSASYNILFGSIFFPPAILFAAHATYLWVQLQRGRLRSVEQQLGCRVASAILMDVTLVSHRRQLAHVWVTVCGTE